MKSLDDPQQLEAETEVEPLVPSMEGATETSVSRHDEVSPPPWRQQVTVRSVTQDSSRWADALLRGALSRLLAHYTTCMHAGVWSLEPA